MFGFVFYLILDRIIGLCFGKNFMYATLKFICLFCSLFLHDGDYRKSTNLACKHLDKFFTYFCNSVFCTRISEGLQCRLNLTICLSDIVIEKHY